MHPFSVLAQEWCKEIEDKTNGRVKITYYPSGTLINPTQTYDGIVKSVIDIGWSMLGYSPGRFPLTEVFDLPLGFKSGVQATRALNAFYQKFKPRELDDVKIFYLHSYAPGSFHTKKPIKQLDDLRGLRIKGAGETTRIIAAAGATPNTVPMSELYDSISRGVCDGAMIPVEGLKGWKLGEVLHCTYENAGSAYCAPFFFAMNKEKWNSLPKDIQDIIEKLNKEYAEKQGKLWDIGDAEAIEWLNKSGKHMFVKAADDEVLKMAERQKPLLDAYVKNVKAKGLPGDEALKWLQDYLKTAPVK
jgi:TRAP-type C4-dicarboxylate transport system substrate-binding protein